MFKLKPIDLVATLSLNPILIIFTLLFFCFVTKNKLYTSTSRKNLIEYYYNRLSFGF